MTHIEQMIQDMCPHGVEFKMLGEVATLSRGKVYSKEYLRDNAGEYPVYSSQTANNGELGRINTYDYDGKYLTWTTDGAYAGTVFRREGRFSITNVCGLISNVDKTLSIDFLYYWLNKVAKGYVYQGMGNPKLMSNVMETIEIPLPPIEIQQKIVECLDKFSALAAELQAELQARRKQYEFYRTQLLTPPQNISSDNSTDERNWKWKTLGEIFELRGGYTPSKNNPEFWEEGTIPWFRMEDIRENGRILKDAILHITPIAVKGKGLFEKDSFVLATSATIGEHALLAVDALTNQRFTNLKVREQYKSVLHTKFIFYYMFKVDEFCKAHTNISGFESVDMDALKKMPFPIPPLNEQKRIADLLDKFEALTTSLSDGIPAEQAAQQKRYEYYRDRLLTFPKAEK